MRDDPRRDQALGMDVMTVVDKLRLGDSLKRLGPDLVGPCPATGCGGDDRFRLNVDKVKFHCRICGGKGGDVIALVRHARGCGFVEALEYLCGAGVVQTDAERAATRDLLEKQAAERDRVAQVERAKAMKLARGIWAAAVPAEGTLVRDYLTRRGLVGTAWAVMPRCLRFAPNLPFMEKIDGAWVQVHAGPAMVAIVQGPDGKGLGVHRTYLDLDQPKGKAVIVHPASGKALPSKKMLGAKKGGAIRLRDPVASDVLVMGEGIETTGTAMGADCLPGAAYWAGVDLGNMAGQMVPVIGVRTSGIPDLADREAFVPPEWCKRLIFIRDGDSDKAATLAKLRAGLVRAQVCRPGLVGQMVDAGDGRDLNDVGMGVGA